MGYSIYIGEACIFNSDHKLSVEVSTIHHPNAPIFEGDAACNNQANKRLPSYNDWSNFAHFTGLHDMFYDPEEGIMVEHPGCYRILPQHLDEVRRALKDFKMKYPKAIPRFAPFPQKTILISYPVEDNHFVRLLWLEYWFTWALENCKIPAIFNS